MADENKHMDDAFKRMSEDFKVPYNSSFWADAEAKLSDSTLDDAFRAAANNVVVSPSFESTESVDDMFMDSAFVEASAAAVVTYDPAMFEQFMQEQGNIIMDEAFQEASAATVVDYLPKYWNDADKALQKEGLHYEYNSAYWAEAKSLLDKSDRRVFFYKWSAVAAILLMLSFTGSFLSSTAVDQIQGMQANTEDVNALYHEGFTPTQDYILENREDLLADKEFGDYTPLNVAEGAINAVNGNNHNNGSNANGNDLIAGNANPHINGVNGGNVHTPSGGTNIVSGGTNPNMIPNDLVENAMNASSVEQNKIPYNASLTGLESPKTHQLGYVRNIPEIEITPPPPLTKHSFGVVAQAGIGNRWGGEFNFMPTFRSSFGVEYLAASGKRFRNFEFGASFMINHVRQSQLTSEDRRTNSDEFSTTKFTRTVHLNDMIFMNANAIANYRFAPTQKIKFGIGFDYLTALRSNMSLIEQTTTDITTNTATGTIVTTNTQTDITTVNNNWGVKEGIRKFDIRFSLGYEYEVSDKLSIQLNSNFGWLDRTDDDFMNEMQKDNEISVMLGLKYNIGSFKR